MRKPISQASSVLMVFVFLFVTLFSFDGEVYALEQKPMPGNLFYSHFFSLEPYEFTYQDFRNNQYLMESSEYDSGSSFNLGTLHKILGYTALVSAGAAIYSGAMMKFKYKEEDKGPGYISAMHEIFPSATIGLFTANAVLGLYQFHDYIGSDAQHNTHFILMTLATLGFCAAPLMSDKFKKPQHAGLAIGSGVAASVGIIVLRF